MEERGRIATLIVPHDAQIGEAGDAIPVRRVRATKTYSSRRVVQAAKALKSGKSALLLGGDALSGNLVLCSRAGSLPLVARIYSAIPSARMERGGGLPSPMKLPYFPYEALELTRRYERVIVADTAACRLFWLSRPAPPSYLSTRCRLSFWRGLEKTLWRQSPLVPRWRPR